MLLTFSTSQTICCSLTYPLLNFFPHLFHTSFIASCLRFSPLNVSILHSQASSWAIYSSWWNDPNWNFNCHEFSEEPPMHRQIQPETHFQTSQRLQVQTCFPPSISNLGDWHHHSTQSSNLEPRELPVTASFSFLPNPPGHRISSFFFLFFLFSTPLSPPSYSMSMLVQAPIISCLNYTWAWKLVFLPLVPSPLTLKLSSLATPSLSSNTPVTPARLVFPCFLISTS